MQVDRLSGSSSVAGKDKSPALSPSALDFLSKSLKDPKSFEQYDTNKDGSFNKKELALALFDKNGDEHLDSEEKKNSDQVLELGGMKGLYDLSQSLDRGKDGHVDASDWDAFMERLLGNAGGSKGGSGGGGSNRVGSSGGSSRGGSDGGNSRGGGGAPAAAGGAPASGAAPAAGGAPAQASRNPSSPPTKPAAQPAPSPSDPAKVNTFEILKSGGAPTMTRGADGKFIFHRTVDDSFIPPAERQKMKNTVAQNMQLPFFKDNFKNADDAYKFLVHMANLESARGTTLSNDQDAQGTGGGSFGYLHLHDKFGLDAQKYGHPLNTEGWTKSEVEGDMDKYTTLVMRSLDGNYQQAGGAAAPNSMEHAMGMWWTGSEGNTKAGAYYLQALSEGKGVDHNTGSVYA
jgi:hypothetical protein